LYFVRLCVFTGSRPFASDPATLFNTIVNVLICPDKFKGSLTAKEVCDAVGLGFLQARPDADLQFVPLADGGEGTCELLTEWHHGRKIELEVHGPLFNPVMAHYGVSGDGHTAFIEMAVASGLTLLKPEEQNPLLTTSLGTGELIADALARKVKSIVIGLGGSATNEAGIGMASALGYKFYDADGAMLKPVGEKLIHIRHITMDGVNPRLKNVSITALCDVTNPLYGPEGAAHIYGPQKGATQPAIELLDAGLRNFGRMIHKHMKTSVDFAGAGAAGGLGAGCKVFLNAAIEKGVNHIIQNTGLMKKIQQSDLIVTGEGKIDRQTFSGKVVSEVIRLAQEAGKPVVAVCGACEVPDREVKAHGILKVISLVGDGTERETAMKEASAQLSRKISAETKNLPGF
jgi:glycerate kinase